MHHPLVPDRERANDERIRGLPVATPVTAATRIA